jgi:hypothetical protein
MFKSFKRLELVILELNLQEGLLFGIWSSRRIHGEHTCDKRTLKKWGKAKKFTREVEDNQNPCKFQSK